MALEKATLYSLSEWKVELEPSIEQDLRESAVDFGWKIPPSLTTCRLADRSRASSTIEHLQHTLEPWRRQRNVHLSISLHDMLDDVICIWCETDQTNLYEQRRICDHDGVVLTDRLAAEALLRGSNLFNAGVLLSTAKQNDSVAVYWAVDKLLRGSKTYAGRAVLIASGKAACSSFDMIANKSGMAVQITNTAGPPLPPMMSNYTDLFVLQNLPSCVVAHALKHTKGILLDMCSAPGGKASHVAAYGDKIVVSCDRSKRRMQTATKLYQTLGLTNIVATALDTTRCILSNAPPKSATEILQQAEYKDGLAQLDGFYPNSFDGILLDPPCSALGLRPRLAITINGRKELDYIVHYQKAFIENAVQLLKPGGCLVYSTCSMRWQENEGMVAHLLDHFSDMELLDVGVNCGGPGLPHKGLDSLQRHKVRRFDPSSQYIGFFVARFRKRN